MINLDASRPGCFAVGPRLDRGVRRPCSLTKTRLFSCLCNWVLTCTANACEHKCEQLRRCEAGACVWAPRVGRLRRSSTFDFEALSSCSSDVTARTKRARQQLPCSCARSAVCLRPLRPERERPATAAQEPDCPAAGTAARSASNDLTCGVACTEEPQRWQFDKAHEDQPCCRIGASWSPNVRGNAGPMALAREVQDNSGRIAGQCRWASR